MDGPLPRKLDRAEIINTLVTVLVWTSMAWTATAVRAEAPAAETAPAAASTAPETVPAASEALKPTLQITSIAISPSKPGVDTLCKLRVALRNDGTETVSALRFDVTVGGTRLAVYERQVFMDALVPGAETNVDLFNFWTTETGRPAPKNGKLTVTVSLRAARSTTIATDESGTETWTVGAPVPSLPSATSTTLALAPSKP